MAEIKELTNHINYVLTQAVQGKSQSRGFLESLNAIGVARTQQEVFEQDRLVNSEKYNYKPRIKEPIYNVKAPKDALRELNITDKLPNHIYKARRVLLTEKIPQNCKTVITLITPNGNIVETASGEGRVYRDNPNGVEEGISYSLNKVGQLITIKTNGVLCGETILMAVERGTGMVLLIDTGYTDVNKEEKEKIILDWMKRTGK